MEHDPDRAARRAKDRILIRDVTPVTPLGLAPKVVAGDAVTVTAQLVADGHDLLAAQVRFRPSPGALAPATAAGELRLTVDTHGAAEGVLTFATPGLYEFQIRAHPDRFATWLRDLLLRRDAGEDLTIEYAEGARILRRLSPRVPRESRNLVREAIASLESTTCSEAVKLRTATSEELLAAVAGRAFPGETTVSKWYDLRVDRELAVFGAWYELFPRSEGGFVRGAGTWQRLEAVARAGFDVLYLPPIHPVGITHRKGRNNALVAGLTTWAARGRSAHPRAATTPSTPASVTWPTSARSSLVPVSWGSRSRWTTRCSAAPTTLG